VEKAIGSASRDRFSGTHVAFVIFHFCIVHRVPRGLRAITRIENTEEGIECLVKTARCGSHPSYF